MAWLSSNFTYRKEITVTNNSGGTLTDHCVRITLNADTFDFTKAKSDGSDLRVTTSDGTTAAKHWKEKPYDNTGEYARFWFKATLTTGANTFYLYYGYASATDADDPDNVFSYFNALEDSADLAALNITDGTTTWSAVTDSASPTGFAINGTNGASTQASKGVLATLPAHYIAEMHVYNTGATDALGAYAGSEVNRADVDNFYRAGGRVTTDGVNAGYVGKWTAGSGAATWFASASGQSMVAGVYDRQVTTWSPELSFDGTGVLSVSAMVGATGTSPQCMVYDSGSDQLYVCSSQYIARYTRGGTKTEEVDYSTLSGTSWSGITIKDGNIYAIRYGSTAYVYEISTAGSLPTAGSITLHGSVVNDTTGSVGGGLLWTGTHFLTSENSASAGTIFRVLTDALASVKSIRMSTADPVIGPQGMFLKDGILYIPQHNGDLSLSSWDNVTLEYETFLYTDTGIADFQGMCWNETDSFWYMAERTTDDLLERTISLESTTKLIHSHLRSPTDAWSSPHLYKQVTSPYTQDEIGIGHGRSSRFAQMHVRPWTLVEPTKVLGAEQTAAALLLTQHIRNFNKGLTGGMQG